MRRATEVTLQHHQILRLTRKMTVMIDPRHMNGATINGGYHPTSPNTVLATKNECHGLSSSHMKRHLQCAGQQKITLQLHQILRLLRKMTLRNFREICRKQMTSHSQCVDGPTMIRALSENDSSMNPSVRNPPRNRGYFSRSPRAFSIEKCNISRSGYHSKLRLPRRVTLRHHQILHLPRKVTLEIQQIAHLPRKVTLEIQPIMHLPRKVTLELHQLVHLSQKVTIEPLLFFDSTILFSTILCYSTEVLLD